MEESDEQLRAEYDSIFNMIDLESWLLDWAYEQEARRYFPFPMSDEK